MAGRDEPAIEGPEMEFGKCFTERIDPGQAGVGRFGDGSGDIEVKDRFGAEGDFGEASPLGRAQTSGIFYAEAISNGVNGTV